MNYVSALRRIAIIGLLAGLMPLGESAWAQTASTPSTPTPLPTRERPNYLRPPAPRPATTENELHIIGTHLLPVAGDGTVRFVGATQLQPEPIAPGAIQGGPNSPRPLPVPGGGPQGSPQGSYEQIDTGWKPIGELNISIAPPSGELPANLAAPLFARAGIVACPIDQTRQWPALSYSWEASAVPHNPLYFEDVNLERYGYSRGILQPWISGGRFFINVVFLPYHIVAEPPGQIQYPLGYYRPGDKAPPVREIKPINLPASVAEAAFVIGMVIILP